MLDIEPVSSHPAPAVASNKFDPWSGAATLFTNRIIPSHPLRRS